MERAFFDTIEAGSRKALVSKVNKYFSKRSYLPASWKVEKDGERYVFYFWGKIDEFFGAQKKEDD